MIRVLLIPSSDYLGHPFPQRHNHIFERLHDGKEFEVHVIRFNIFGKPRLTSKCIIHEIPLEVKISNTALYYGLNVANHVREILKIVKQESIDVVVAGNLLPPLTYSIVQQLLERKIPFIFDLQDYYPTSAAGYIANTEAPLGLLAKGFFEVITQHLIKIANTVVTPGIALALYARKAGARRVKIIPNGISEHFLKKHDGRKIREKLGYNINDIVVGYIGSIEFWLDMEPLIKAIAQAHKQKTPIKLLIIGKHLQTRYSRKVKKWIRKYGIEKITTWLDFIPHEEVPKYIAAMNIGTIPFDVENPTAYYAAPNKLWEYISQNIPALSTPIPEAFFVKKQIAKSINGIKIGDLLHIVHNIHDYLHSFIKLPLQMRSKEFDKEIKKILISRLWAKMTAKYAATIKYLVNIT